MRALEVVAVIAAGILFLLAVIFVPFSIIFELIAGWFSFATRVLPALQIRLGGVAMFIASFLVAIACCHYFLRWFVGELNRKRETDNQIHWPIRSSVALIVLVMLLFVVGIGITGVTHQVGWLLTSPEPMFRSDTQTLADSDRSTYRPGSISTRIGPSWLWNSLVPLRDMRPEIDEAKPWNAPENANAFRTLVYEGICPSQGTPLWSPDSFGLSHNAGNPDVFDNDSVRTFGDLDSFGETIFAGEINAGFVPWADETSVRSLHLGLHEDWDHAGRGEVG